MSSRKCFPLISCFCCRSRAESFVWAWLPFGLCRTGCWSWVGDRQHVSPLPLQPLHRAAQLLNASCLGAELLVQPFYPDAKCSLGLTLVSSWTLIGLYGERFTAVCTKKLLVSVSASQHLVQHLSWSNDVRSLSKGLINSPHISASSERSFSVLLWPVKLPPCF